MWVCERERGAGSARESEALGLATDAAEEDEDKQTSPKPDSAKRVEKEPGTWAPMAHGPQRGGDAHLTPAHSITVSLHTSLLTFLQTVCMEMKSHVEMERHNQLACGQDREQRRQPGKFFIQEWTHHGSRRSV
ncbi:unnamed protein product [Lampetra planeri]